MASLFDNLLGALTGGQGTPANAGREGAAAGGGSPLAQIAALAMQNPQLLQVVAGMFTAGNKHGGLQGMVEKFTQAGLGDTANSWLSQGENKSITPSQIEQVFGAEGIQRISQKAGVAPSQTPDLLSQILPAVISGLSPGGSAPSQSQAPQSADALIGMLGGLFGKR